MTNHNSKKTSCFVCPSVIIARKIPCARNLAEKFGAPVIDLLMRLVVANIFFTSGWLKFDNFLNGNWESTVMLFEYEHPVPGLSPDFAAVLATGGEVILPILLAFGLFTRFGALGLLVMTAVIEFTYQHSMEHIYMALLLATIACRGGGLLSIDHFWGKTKCCGSSSCKA